MVVRIIDRLIISETDGTDELNGNNGPVNVLKELYINIYVVGQILIQCFHQVEVRRWITAVDLDVKILPPLVNW